MSNTGGKWRWKEFGEDDEYLNTEAEKIFGKRECGPVNELGFVKCHHYGEIVNFNRDSLRFQVIESHGYVVALSAMKREKKERKTNTPYFKIGKCSKTP